MSADGTTSNVQRLELHKAIEIAFSDFPLRQKGITNLSTPYMSGPPGGGKTQSIRAKCEELGMGFVARNTGMMRMEELGGIPDFVRKEEELHTEWSIPELVCTLREVAKNGPVVCLLDDWHLAPPAIQALGYELFTDYSIKGHAVPRECLFVLAGNDTPAAGAKTQFSAVMNRVAKMYVETSFEYWRDNYAYPAELFLPIVSFLEGQENRSHFHGEEDVINPWASPRAWTNLSFKLQGMMESGMFDTLTDIEQLITVSSHVGVKAATSFHQYYKIYSQFDTKTIFDTGRYKIPKDAVDRFAFTFAMSSEFYNRYKDSDIKCGKVYAKLLKDLESEWPELAMTSVRFVTSIDREKIIEAIVRDKIITMDLLRRLLETSNLIGDN
ncbi:MAG: hypothetical protein KAS32_05465 [Candidatus Peribacteraceae bacterium]|nr:hypothetical protein [Candidatus Peribacteraceae bacterium]